MPIANTTMMRPANGNLIEMTPNGSNPANGAIRYSYNAANQLNKIETCNGSYSTLAQMNYDGLGNRARLIAWAGGVPLTTTYATRIAGQIQILQVASGSNSTMYLYGLNAIAEFGSQSVYYLTDGSGSIRQLADLNGAVVLTRWYEPLGQILTQRGSSDASYGYLGAEVDRITGLLYINGAYYDPITGRFLSPNGSEQNPYVPLGGAALVPILILALLRRKKKGQLWAGWLVLAVMLSVGFTIAACGTNPTPSGTPRSSTTPKQNTGQQISTPVSIPSATQTPPASVPLPQAPIPCPTPSTPTSALKDFWIENESMETRPDVKKVIEFRFQVEDGGNVEDFALVNFVKGYSKYLDTGEYGPTTMFGVDNVDDNWPDWHIDSWDNDPVFGTYDSNRWPYTRIDTNTASAGDEPNAPKGMTASKNYRMCIYRLDSVPNDASSTNAETLMKEAIRCIDWDFKATYNYDGTITYP